MSTLVSTDDLGRRPTGLTAAFLVALALHVGALGAIAYYRLSPPAPPGENTISIDLAPQMTEAETQAPQMTELGEVAPPVTKPVETPDEAEPVKPPDMAEPVKPPPVNEIVPDEAVAEAPPEVTPPPPAVAITETPPDIVPVEPESQVITSTAEQAEPLVAPPPVTAEAPKEIKPEEVKPDLAKLAAEREAKLKAIKEAKRKAEADAKRRELVEERREAAKEAKDKAAKEARARQSAERAGRDAANSASTSRQASTGSAAASNDPSAMRQWTGAIQSAIHGRMNRDAASGTAGGVAVLRFTVSRSGQVLGASLASSSGIGAIDSAALATARGGLPAAPSGVTVPSLSVTVPLRFSPGR